MSPRFKLLFCLILACLLVLAVADDRPKENWTVPQNKGGDIHLDNNGLTRVIQYRDASTGKVFPLEYPWAKEHDARPGRRNHQYWGGYGIDHAYCTHINPGRFPPQADPETYFGKACVDKLHKPLHKHLSTFQEDEYNDMGCWLHDANVTRAHGSEYKWYMWRNMWSDAEDCRAGCETCFDAMHEYGAEAARCGRQYRNSACWVGLIPHWENRSWNEDPFQGRYIYYGDNEAMVKHHWEYPDGKFFRIPGNGGDEGQWRRVNGYL